MKLILYLSDYMIPLIIFYIIGFGLLSRRPVYDDFVEGAKGRGQDGGRHHAYAHRSDGGGGRAAGLRLSGCAGRPFSDSGRAISGFRPSWFL